MAHTKCRGHPDVVGHKARSITRYRGFFLALDVPRPAGPPLIGLRSSSGAASTPPSLTVARRGRSAFGSDRSVMRWAPSGVRSRIAARSAMDRRVPMSRWCFHARIAARSPSTDAANRASPSCALAAPASPSIRTATAIADVRMIRPHAAPSRPPSMLRNVRTQSTRGSTFERGLSRTPGSGGKVGIVGTAGKGQFFRIRAPSRVLHARAMGAFVERIVARMHEPRRRTVSISSCRPKRARPVRCGAARPA